MFLRTPIVHSLPILFRKVSKYYIALRRKEVNKILKNKSLFKQQQLCYSIRESVSADTFRQNFRRHVRYGKMVHHYEKSGF